MRPNAANSPLPWRAQRDVIRPNGRRSGPNHGGGNQGAARCTERSIPPRTVTQKAAREKAWSIPLEDIDAGQPELFRTDSFWPYFDRLRKEDPVHYCKDSMFGPYWSVTKYNDIMDIETNHSVFSSAASLGGITIRDVAPDLRRESFIAMDQPRHGAQRKTVAPMFTPTHLDQLAINIRKRVGRMPRQSARQRGVRLGRPGLDRTDHADARGAVRLPLGGPPQADALVRRRNHASRPGRPGRRPKKHGRPNCWNARPISAELWKERINQPPKNDLLSMMAHSEATRDMDPKNFLGNLILLIVGGNDTTRNTLSGSIYALNKNPDQYRKLRENPDLIDSFVPEVIRWQTPLAHMRRTALEDIEFRGKQIKKGDKVVMWYVSGNRDEEVIERPYEFIIDRARPRTHISFGFGIHRCVGMRLAELQLKIIWEEILKRFDTY